MKNLINLLSLNLFVLMLVASCTGTHKLGMQKVIYEQTGQCRRLEDGDNEITRDCITLRCLGDVNPNHVYLDGNASNGTVKLSPNTEGNYTGTHWQVERLGDGNLALKCLSTSSNPDYVYLDGTPADGTVKLSPNTAGHYTGTHWREELLGNGDLAFRCLGGGPNPQHLYYLDAFTKDGTVKLAPNTEQYTGTHWRVGSIQYILRVVGRYEQY